MDLSQLALHLDLPGWDEEKKGGSTAPRRDLELGGPDAVDKESDYDDVFRGDDEDENEVVFLNGGEDVEDNDGDFHELPDGGRGDVFDGADDDTALDDEDDDLDDLGEEDDAFDDDLGPDDEEDDAFDDEDWDDDEEEDDEFDDEEDEEESLG